MERHNQSQIDIQKENNIIRETFSTLAGEEALKILKTYFYARPSYTQQDPYHTAFKEGQRDVVGFIIEAKQEGVDSGEDIS